VCSHQTRNFDLPPAQPRGLVAISWDTQILDADGRTAIVCGTKYWDVVLPGPSHPFTTSQCMSRAGGGRRDQVREPALELGRV